MSRTVFVLKVYVIVKKKKTKKKKKFDLTPIWTRTKCRVYMEERPNTKKTIIYKNQIKNIKIKIINIKAVCQRPKRNKLPPRTSRKHRLPNC